MATWNNYNVKLENQIEYNDMVIKTYHISDLLSQYPGKLSAWEHYDEVPTLALGLASQEGIIDEDKLNAFLDMDYTETKDALNIMIYDYYFELTHLNGSHFNPNLTKGTIKDTTTVSTTRLVIYNGEEALLQFSLER